MKTASVGARLRGTFGKRPVILALTGGIIVLAVALIVRASTGNRGETAVYHVAKRGDFLVSIVEGGTLKALNDIKIRSEVEGSARILSIVPEGSYVTKGDLLVELDSAEIREKLSQQEISFENNRSSYIQAREALAIQQSQAESNLKEAELKVEFAKSDLEKFIEGEGPLQLQTATNKITIIQEELKRAEDRLRWTKQLQEKGYATTTELNADELGMQRKIIELEQAKEDQRLLIKYDQPNRLRQLESNLEQAKMELERTKHRAASQIAQAEADLRSRESTLRLAELKLNQLRAQFDKTKIHAPQDGLVVYAIRDSYSSSSTMIEEGASIRERQEIIQLPDISQMMLEVRIHESHVGQVRAGQLAYVTVDAMPDRQFRGRVRRVSLLPDSQSRWGNPNLKVYSTEILIDEKLPNINPGVSARAEIVITNLQDVVTVPIQAITTRHGKQVAYVSQRGSVNPVPVEVGLYNDRFIEVASGIGDGDRVLLSPPISRESSEAARVRVDPSRMDETASSTGGTAPAAAANPPEASARDGGEANGPTTARAADGAEGRGNRPDAQRMREELEKLSPEERETRLREFRERRGSRPQSATPETEK